MYLLLLNCKRSANRMKEIKLPRYQTNIINRRMTSGKTGKWAERQSFKLMNMETSLRCMHRASSYNMYMNQHDAQKFL